MLDPRQHATLVPRDPARLTCLATWSTPSSDTRAAEPSPQEQLIELVLPGPEGPAPRLVAARVQLVQDVLDELIEIPHDHPTASGSMRVWSAAARSALEVVANGRIQPAASPDGWDEWAPGPLSDHDRSVRSALAAWLPPTAHCHPSIEDGKLLLTAADAVALFSRAVADALPRTAAAASISRQPAWCSREPVDVTALRSHLIDPDTRASTIVGLRVSMPEGPDQPFRARLQVRDGVDESKVADVEDLWAGRADGFDENAEAEVLIALRRGSRLWPPLGALLEVARPSRMDLDDEQAMALFGPLAADLGGAGIEVLVPASAVRRVSASAHAEPPPGVGDQPPNFDLATVCELTWRATLEGEPLDDAELSALAAAKRPLVRLRGHWVVVDPTVTARLGRRERLGPADTLAAALGGTLTIDGETVDVTVGDAIADLADRIRKAGEPGEVDEPTSLHATLRPYQRRGVAWMHEMVTLGLGGVLADDMGLGKTIQLIALHLHRLDLGDGPTLVVCPASLVGNWQRELARFAPSVRVHRFHGSGRSIEHVGPNDLVITTYGIVRRDTVELSGRSWGLLAADEAQQMKNPNSVTSRAMRKLDATAGLALTGTPVENRLTELWSLLDWTTPGLLGTVDSFRRSVAIPIERDRDPETTERFATVISPFLLRRRKDDPEIAPDLPPKTETDHPVALGPEQAGLYRAVVEEVLDAIGRADGMARRGLVLKLLTSLKQVCNHPAHYLRQSGPLAGRSGKLDVFDDLMVAISDAGDSTLVFTQYVTMGNLLMTRLEELGITAEFLHGGLTLTRRSDMVDRFQAGDFGVMVISLKAGGTGLNLTRATHVVHYDRWWNPAVEQQASDRAWRIGQDRPVQIHRLISEGTIEDRIAAVLNDKKALADTVVGSGESWLTELDDAALADLVRLGEATD